MFLRKQIKNGKEYWSLVRAYRQGGKGKQETLGIGTEPSLDSWHWRKYPQQSSPKVKRLDKLLTDDQKIKIYEGNPELQDEYIYFQLDKPCQWNEVVDGKLLFHVCCEPKAEGEDFYGSKMNIYCKKHQEEEKIRTLNANETMKKLFSGIFPNLAARKQNYEILGLKEGATKQEIKNRYKELAKKLHPDMVGGDTETFKLIKTAYERVISQSQ